MAISNRDRQLLQVINLILFGIKIVREKGYNMAWGTGSVYLMSRVSVAD